MSDAGDKISAAIERHNSAQDRILEYAHSIADERESATQIPVGGSGVTPTGTNYASSDGS